MMTRRFPGMSSLLDVEWLRCNSRQIHSFGLGFIQIKITDLHRLHVYCSDVTTTTSDEDVHDHRYSFKSDIIKGSLTNLLYSLDYSQNTHILSEESCNPNKPIETPIKTSCGILEVGSFTLESGSSYSLHHATLHRVVTNRAITFLTREMPVKDSARVVTIRDGIKICPFSVNLPVEELWRIVARELHDPY